MQRLFACIIIYINNANLSKFTRTHSKFLAIFVKAERRAGAEGDKKKGGAARVARKLLIA